MSDIKSRTKFRGLYTRNSITRSRPETAFVARNIKIDGFGIRPIRGIKTFGNVIATGGQKIRDSKTFVLQDGTEIPVRIRDNNTNNIAEWYDSVNNTWYILYALFTKALNTSLVDFNSTDANQLIFNNGTDALAVWSGNHTRLTAAVTAGATTINVASTAGFPASGSIIYNGTEIAYSAKAATTFTVASAHASAGADDGVAQALTGYPSLTQGDVMVSALNRLWVRSQTDKNSIEYSDEGDALTWSGGSNRADSGIEDFPIEGGDITGISVKDDWMIFFKRHSIVGFTFTYPDSTSKVPNYKNILNATDIGAINHKGIAVGYNEILYVAKNGIRSLSKIPSSTNDFNADPISNRIKTTIKDYDFSEASSVYYEKEDVFLVACKSNSDQTHNNKVIAMWFYDDFDADGNLFRTSDFSILDLTIECWFKYDGKLYGGSSMEGNVYEIFTGSSFAGTAINSNYTNNRDDFGKPAIKGMNLYIVEGLIAPGTELKYKFIFDGGRAPGITKIISASGDYVSNSAINTMGTYVLGEQVLGGVLGDVEGLKPFRAIMELGNQNFYDMQIERTCSINGGDFFIYYEAPVDVTENYNLTPNL